MHKYAPGLGLELVAEVTGEAAGEVERQLGRGGAQPLELAFAVVEDALLELLRSHRERLRRDVVAHDLPERAVGCAHEGEAREPGFGAGAVEPDGVSVVAVERDERGLRVAPRDGPMVDRHSLGGPRRARPRAASLGAGEVA